MNSTPHAALPDAAETNSSGQSRPTPEGSRPNKLVLGVSLPLLVILFAMLLSRFGSAFEWRLEVYARKLSGDLPELHWTEIASMTFTRDRYRIASAVMEGRSLDAAIRNPFDKPEDVEAGKAIFHERCSACHGSNAAGSHGPSLLRETFDHGDNPFAIYRVLRDGVASTAMVPTRLGATQRWQVISFIATLRSAAAEARAASSRPAVMLTEEALLAAGTRTDEWLMYSGSYKGWRYSSLSEITPKNVASLRPLWMRQTTGAATTQISTPIVSGDTIYLSEAPSSVVALDARTGHVLWRYERPLPSGLPICCGTVNRGLAISGANLYVSTLDAHLVALDAVSGRMRWDVEVADSEDGYSMTVAPLAVGNTIVVGVSGAEYATRGFLAAYDREKGKKVWQFDTIPGPGAAGHETWENDAWKTGGGSTWVTGSYDPELGLIYWGVGNPTPVYQGAARPGDNLYTGSVIALNASTGELAWHFQFTPHDDHDWDSAQTPVLAELDIQGIARSVICWPNRNGFYYVLDRKTGEYLLAKPFARQNWALGIDPQGRPILDPERRVNAAGVLTYPSVGGATNWHPPAFDPVSKLIYVHFNDQGSVYTSSAPGSVKRGERNLYVASGAANVGSTLEGVRAIDAATGEQRWERFQTDMRAADGSSGLLATAGGVLFGANRGYLFALDSATGEEVWRLGLGGYTGAPPVSFTLDGRQVVGIWGGRTYFLFGL